MKVAIITITDGENYGNRLQNYALEQVLNSLGHDVETIKRLTIRDLGIKLKGIRFIYNIICALLHLKGKHAIMLRKRNFKEFNKRYVSFSKYKVHDNIAPKKLADAYDYFVCGSDQIWNPLIRIAIDDIDNGFAKFAKNNQRISYAASFGISELPYEYMEKYKQLLEGMKAISVREKSGIEIVKKVSGRDATLVLDPTLMLSKEQWIAIEKKPKWHSQKRYILTYFLGGRNDKINLFLEQKAKQEFQIINLDFEFIGYEKIENEKHFSVGPDEFIYLIHNCEIFLTDSFHGSVFSILFKKNFKVYDRKEVEVGNNMGTRISSLLEMFHLEQCSGDLNDEVEITECSFDNVDEILKAERMNSYKYLRKVLS